MRVRLLHVACWQLLVAFNNNIGPIEQEAAAETVFAVEEQVRAARLEEKK